MKKLAATKAPTGNPTQKASFTRMCNPEPLKNAATLKGETAMGLHGAKYRVSSNGIRNPTPSPPLVKASKIPWDIVAKNTNAASNRQVWVKRLMFLKATKGTVIPMARANRMEWLKPRCPNESA